MGTIGSGVDFTWTVSPPSVVPRRREAAPRQLPDSFSLPRIVCPAGLGGGTPQKVGIFGGIHGDEPSGPSACQALAAWARRQPGALAGLELHIYPECNPTGLAARSRYSANGLDLNREFWRGSDQAEVRWLESQLRAERYNVIVALHEDDTSDGLYGFVGGGWLSERLLDPALAAAGRLLPRNTRGLIDGFPTDRGIIRDGYRGMLSAPPEQRSSTLEVVFETPGHSPLPVRTEAAVLAVQTMLAEYGKLLAGHSHR